MMPLAKSYKQVTEELQKVRNEIVHLRKTPISNTRQQLEVILQINLLLRKNNELLLIRQEQLEDRKSKAAKSLENLISKFT